MRASKKVATIHDKKAYGQGLVTAFTEAFRVAAARWLPRDHQPDDTDFSAVISKVKCQRGLLRR